jgi:hypothetical protein
MTTPVSKTLPIVNGYQMTLRLAQDGQAAAIVLGCKGVGGTFMVESDAVLWRDSAWAAFRPLMVATVTPQNTTVRSCTKDGIVWELGAPSTGTAAATGSTTLAAACTLIKWSTTQGGRSGKGRTFLPGLPATAMAAGGRSYTAAWSTAVATAVSNYLASAPFTAPGLKPAVLSFTRGEAYVIQSGGLAGVVGVQRRRMRG